MIVDGALPSRRSVARNSMASRPVLTISTRFDSGSPGRIGGYLLDEGALQALLDELEAALEQCHSLNKPDEHRQAIQTYADTMSLQSDRGMVFHQSLTDHSGAGRKGT